jgi:hypothetical protein
MSYPETLKELQEHFGKKMMLSSSDIAPYIAKSRQAQASFRYRNKKKAAPKSDVLLNPQKRGGRYYIDIRSLARYISGDDLRSELPQEAAAAVPPENPPSRPHGSKRQADNDPRRPYRRPPSLRRVISQFQSEVSALERELDFRRELFAKLEEAELRRTMDKASSKKRPPASNPKPGRV